jgi:hypothetical protein
MSCEKDFYYYFMEIILKPISVEKVAFSVTLRTFAGACSQALQLRLYIGLQFAVVKAKVFPHLEA